MTLITGTNGDDTLLGTTGKDVIRGYGGDDLLIGNGNRDTLSGGTGDDTISGGALGDDIYGGDGDDVISSGGQADFIRGGAGNDLIYADDPGSSDPYSEAVYGDDGDDTIYGGTGNGTGIHGGAGNDFIYGDASNDILSGGLGNDFIFTGGGNDVIDLGGGNDTIADFAIGTDKVILGSATPTGTADMLARFSTDGNGDAVYDLGDGSTVTFEGHSIADFKATDLGALTDTFIQSPTYTLATSGMSGFDDPLILELDNGDLTVAVPAASTFSGSNGADIFFQVLSPRYDDTIPGIDGFDTVTGIVQANNVQDTVQGIDEWSYTQNHPTIAATADGGFVMQWDDYVGTSSDPDVYMKYFDATGAAVDINGDSDNTNDGFFISTASGTTPSAGSIATLNDGNIVSLYSEPDGLKFTIVERTGSAVSLSTQTTVTSSVPSGSSVAALADGGFVAVWGETSGDTGSKYQRFAADGTAVDSSPVEFRNGTTPGMTVMGLTEGGFVVTELGGVGATDHKVYLFGSDPSNVTELGLGDPGNYPYGSRYGIAALSNGGFAVSFDSHKTGENGYVTVFRADGSIQEEAIPVAGTGTGGQQDLDVTALADGGFAVTWLGGPAGVHTRVFEADTTALTLTATAGQPTYGAWGDDTLSGSSSGDYLWGDAGADLISGGDGADTIYGGAGNDVLHGDAGADTLFGGSGNDHLDGGAGADVLSGGLGADTLTGGGGADVIVGSAVELDGDTIADFSGQDSIRVTGVDLSALDGTVTTGTIDLGGGRSLTLDGVTHDGLSASYDSVSGTTTISFGGLAVTGTTGADTLLGGSSGDTLVGLDGDDVLSGAGGGDTLSGGLGADTLVGGAGSDLLAGGDGADVFAGSAAELDGDTIADFSGQDSIQVAGVDLSSLDGTVTTGTVDLGGGQSLTLGGVSYEGLAASYDSVSGTTTISFGGLAVTGTTGADTLLGGSSADALSGLGGDDVLSGAGGDDTLSGGLGSDTLVGGAGNDVFVIAAGDGDDSIADFAVGADHIDTDAVFVDQAALDAAATDVGSDVVVDLGGGQSLTLIGVQAANLVYTDFI